MKITNKLGLPQPIVDAVKNDDYTRDGAHISITGLIRPARLAALEEKHWSSLEEDASSRIWSLVGQVMAGILERSNKDGMAEKRFAIQVEGWNVSGQIDRYFDGILQDYKFVTAYKFKRGEVPEEYEQQLNCYAELLRQNDYPVRQVEIIGILRDWSKLEAARDPEYPQTQVLRLPVSLWSEERARKFIKTRVILHQKARITLPECSEEERWAKPAVYAVMKRGQKRAVKLYGSQIEADTHAALDSSFSVIYRPGDQVRCQHYCSVARFCTQFQTLSKQDEDEVA